MPRISIIGAGGYVFPLTLIRDICCFPALRESTISMMDIDADRLERNADGAPDGRDCSTCRRRSRRPRTGASR